ncbi:hypothetical protein L1049_016817 [Liquidambar formosana]|uniref:Transposase-associated domain-containing protein n=1 Tax=Liquidambar formosana TaxID=63359 RepID=A0AAP0S775_LIQFO
MDKTWMHLNKLSPEYEQGIKDFMNFARGTVDRANRMRCPCCRCKNVYYRIVDEVEDHLFVNGINPKYTRWIHHGEDFEPIIHDDANDDDDMADDVDDYVDEVQEILEDLHGGTFMDSCGLDFGSSFIDKFEIDLSRPNVKHTVDTMLKNRHKNWRHKLYKFYKEFPPQEASQHLPKDVKQNDWDHLLIITCGVIGRRCWLVFYGRTICAE